MAAELGVACPENVAERTDADLLKQLEPAQASEAFRLGEP